MPIIGIKNNTLVMIPKGALNIANKYDCWVKFPLPPKSKAITYKTAEEISVPKRTTKGLITRLATKAVIPVNAPNCDLEIPAPTKIPVIKPEIKPAITRFLPNSSHDALFISDLKVACGCCKTLFHRSIYLFRSIMLYI